MELDMTRSDDEVTKIIFDRRDSYSIHTYLSPSCDEYFEVKTTKSDDGDNYYIRYEAIDNLIKALQKAKELWT